MPSLKSSWVTCRQISSTKVNTTQYKHKVNSILYVHPLIARGGILESNPTNNSWIMYLWVVKPKPRVISSLDFSTKWKYKENNDRKWHTSVASRRRANMPASMQTALSWAPLKSSVERANSSKLTSGRTFIFLEWICDKHTTQTWQPLESHNHTDF